MSTQTLLDESTLLQEIAGGSNRAFEQLFKLYYASLTGYAYTFLKDSDQAAEVSQAVFVKFWEKREEINITLSVKSYLFRAVFNSCMNVKKHEEIKQNYRSEEANYAGFVHEDSMTNWELKEQLNKAIAALPEQCRKVFIACKLDGKKYKEIAAELGISEKTVENHMGKALKDLRKHLEFLLVLVLAWILFYHE